MKQLEADLQTIDFYEKSFEIYDTKTFNLDLSVQWNIFASKVKPRGKILDVGCGTGRDIKHFQSLGFLVDGLEPSKNMATLANARTHAHIFNIPIEAIDLKEHYDGVWACASLVHVKKDLFPKTIEAIIKSLKYGGYLYISLKEGNGQARLEDGRLFSYFTKEEIFKTVDLLPNASIVKFWSSTDSAGREDVTWLNTIIQKDNLFNKISNSNTK
ncbi:class I SAM-dependent methyltransferase [Pseudomonas sp.]|uniref:class I SAM-dependent methyltransferase n=1 Tax=Pseudomonas sp. TaxID=306 RepID=UPI00263945B0|nr:class I SAM-dependent methyltransferase [Pseudomonas sp.]